MRGPTAALTLFCAVASASAASSTPKNVPALPKGTTNVTVTKQSGILSDSFVTAKDGKLYLDGEEFTFRMMNAPLLLTSTSDFENIDTFETLAAFGNPVTRTYVLTTVEDDQFGGYAYDSESLIQGWSNSTDDWIYNEKFLQAVDLVLDRAASYGVKMIIPIVNEDYGDDSSDWYGNFVDLIRIRHDIKNYTVAQSIDFFTDTSVRTDFKKIITKFLTRTNTVNGKVWGQDPTILAWETGNEMNHARVNASNITVHDRPAPADWTIEIAEHIKSLAPDTLVMDGSFSRNYMPNASWPEEVLTSDAVDIVSYHFYGDGDIEYFSTFSDYAKQYGKVFIIGEHGFYSNGAAFKKAYEALTDDIAGAGIWSMRPHAATSGFRTHSEGSGIYSYHFPGWNVSEAPDFAGDEWYASEYTYQASWEIAGKTPPVHPIPGLPQLSDASNATFGYGVQWRGAAWAAHYELWAASLDAPFFEPVGLNLTDNVDQGALFVPVTPSQAGINITVSIDPAPQPSSISWSDPKWDFHHGAGGGSQHHKRMAREKTRRGEAGICIACGSWYLVRGVSVEGVPGPFSSPIWIEAGSLNGTSSS